MSEWKKPDWLEEALSERDSPPVPFPDSDGPRRVHKGEIRAARPMDGNDGARLVLILDESPLGWTNTMLLSNLVEAPTSKDVRLLSDETGLTYPVLVETDIVGPMFVAQFGPLLGRVDQELIPLLHAVKRGDDSEVLADRRGLPIRSRHEKRARWKAKELQAMHDLAGECFAELMMKEEQEAPVLVDPGFFEDLDDRDNVGEAVAVLAQLAKMGRLDVPAEALAGGKGRLKSWLGQLDPTQIAALEEIWNGALLSRLETPEASVQGALQPRRNRESEVLVRSLAARLGRGERNVSIATRSSFWEEEEDESDGVMKLRMRDGRVVQLSPVFVEGAAA